MALENAGYPGTSHLIATQSLVRYNDYVYGLISRRLPKGGDILEFGPGLGDFVKRFHRDGVAVDCVENEPEFHPYLRSVSRRVASSLAELPGLYDAIFSVNVLEHIEDDRAFLRQFHAKLKPGGLLSLYLPAGPMLYSHLDALVRHYRRYSREELVGKVRDAGFAIEETRLVDSAGFFVYGLYKLLRWGDGNITPWSMTLYDALVFPVSRVLDPLLGRRLGRSVFLLARKPA